jgi:thiol:disulfide interchange protein DsbD
VSWVACRLECISEEDSVALSLSWADTAATDDRRLVADALARLPSKTPSAWVTSGESVGTTIVLNVHAAIGGEVRSADFFPADAGVIEHSAPVTATIGESLTLRLARSRYALSTPARIAGLVVLRSNDGSVRSYDVEFPIGQTVASTAAVGTGWAGLLMLAFLGGLLVNIMPCVFPLLGIKAMSLASTTTRPADRTLRALTYAAGSVVSSVLIGGALLMTSDPAQGAWGFQMQSPRFLGFVAILLFAAALSLLGVFEVPTLWPSWLGPRTDQLSAKVGSFVAGAGAILIGAPCTAPFFGVALAGALLAPRAIGLATFVCFGIGAAAPFVLLAVIPRSLAFVPRPGRWMETMKQLFAFPLLAAAAWLVWVAQLQTGAIGSAALLASLCAVAFGVWILGRWRTVSSPQAVRRAALVGFILVVGAGLAAVGRLTVVPRTDSEAPASELRWSAYTDARRDSLLAAGHPVFVDFTAAWCLTCKVNEIGTLQSERVVMALQSRSVGLLRADLTVRDSALTRALHAVGGASVPTYALYAPDPSAQPRLLPTLLTPAAVIDAVELASTRPTVAAAGQSSKP